MRFRIEFAGPAGRYLSRLDPSTRTRVAAAIRGLADDPSGLNTKALHGRPERSLRVGGWRVLYTVDRVDGLATITAIAPRGQAYRGR